MSAPHAARPTDLLFNILVTFLCPLFLGGPTGNADVAVARAAATEMLNSFRIRNAWDLLAAVQVVGFAMAGVGSLGLSMDDDLPVNTVLRCRSNANALQRSSDRAQARMDKRQAQEAGQPDTAPPDAAAVLEACRQAADAQRMVATAQARMEGTEPADAPGMIALREVLERELSAKGYCHRRSWTPTRVGSTSPPRLPGPNRRQRIILWPTGLFTPLPAANLSRAPAPALPRRTPSAAGGSARAR